MYERCSVRPCANGVVWCCGMGENKYVKVVWSYVEKEE